MNNSQKSTSVEVNNEGVQRMIDNSSAMHRSNHMIIAQGMSHRLVNTIKVYTAKQEEWKAWCNDQDFEDGQTVFDSKLSYFLMEHVSKRGRKCRKLPDRNPLQLGMKSYNAYVKAVSDLCKTQKALGWNPNGVARGPLVATFFRYSRQEKRKKPEGLLR